MTHRHRPTAKPRARFDRPPAPANFAWQEHSRNDFRASIAHSAARLIVQGLTDYHAAKQKAAKQHGVTDSHALPDNREIELAVREHLALFCRENQPRALSALRETAVRMMLRLEPFSPWLVGAVLNGTANEFSEIELELIGIEPKNFEIYLLNAGIEFELCNTHKDKDKGASSTREHRVSKYRVEFDGTPVTIALYDHHIARLAAHPRDSMRHDRAQREQAERRFIEESGKS